MTERRQQNRRGDVALTLFGVTVNDAHTGDIGAEDVVLVPMRELAAICGEAPYSDDEPSEAVVQAASDTVGRFAASGPVLPTPPGVIFRSEESVKRWLELHYSALSGALSYVENRVAARVHVYRPNGPEDEREAGSDLAAVAAESMRVLRRAAVASVPLRTEKITGVVLSAAFLIEDELWKNFVDEVEAQGKTATNMRFEVTGPWPPYDFVQMQLGS